MLLLCTKNFSTRWQNLDTVLVLLWDYDNMVINEANTTLGVTHPNSRNTCEVCFSCYLLTTDIQDQF